MADNNKGQTIFLSVIGIATLLVAIVGATFAWFSTTISGNGTTANVTTATISALSLTGTSITGGDNVLPGWESADGEFSVSGSVTGDVSVPYTCKITKTINAVGTNPDDQSEIKIDITDLQYRVSADGATDSTAGTWTTIGESGSTVVTGNITAANAEDTYKIAVRFPETGEDQNAQQGADVTATVTCEITGGTIYYTDGQAGGTTTEPEADQ